MPATWTNNHGRVASRKHTLTPSDPFEPRSNGKFIVGRWGRGKRRRVREGLDIKAMWSSSLSTSCVSYMTYRRAGVNGACVCPLSSRSALFTRAYKWFSLEKINLMRWVLKLRLLCWGNNGYFEEIIDNPSSAHPQTLRRCSKSKLTTRFWWKSLGYLNRQQRVIFLSFHPQV